MTQFDFWSQNPCGADGNFKRVAEQRYRLEPWLPREIKEIPRSLERYLEIGCGQGTDSYFLCSHVETSAEHIAIDYSKESVERARNFVDEAKDIFDLNIVPDFRHGNALDLDFQSEEFDFVYSMGVLHHTPDPQKAVDEVFRVLKPGGQAKIFLYKRPSLKVGIAKFLRMLQWMVDKLFFQERVFYKLIQGRYSHFFGSMFLECFGVPWMEWYSRNELQQMFRNFSAVEIQPYEFNFPKQLGTGSYGYNRLGYFYLINARKP
ncbi:MAG: hypothetical protein CMM48_16480 [Rhodospirillaceae bacterium]|nr:hypothetical protein [Rhodospirillaceae bacterium]|tara:strand:- start:319 stop:1104 length:786 start_codon:yes stop_codon:yes gene_type:complete